MLVDFEALFKAAFLPKRQNADTVKSAEDEEERAPVVKYRKSQRLYHCKLSRKMVHVGRLLDKLMKHEVWSTLSEKLEAEDPRKVANPIDLAMIRCNIELGLYSHPEMCVSDIRLAFANAQAVCRDNSHATIMAREQLKLLQDDFEKELFAGKMDLVAYGHRLQSDVCYDLCWRTLTYADVR